MKAARAARDLGATTSGGKTRRTSEYNERQTKQQYRKHRIRKLVYARRRARKLIPTGYQPATAFASEVLGLSPAQARQARTNLTYMLGLPKGSCATTSIAIYLKPENEPFIHTLGKQLKLWTWLVQQPNAHRRIATTWAKALPRLQKEKNQMAQRQRTNLSPTSRPPRYRMATNNPYAMDRYERRRLATRPQIRHQGLHQTY